MYGVFSWVKKVAKADSGVNENHAGLMRGVPILNKFSVFAKSNLAHLLDKKCVYDFN